jgi:hypothetical protein
MADDGYLIGFEDSNGNFVEVGRFNNAGTSVTQPIELVHSSSGKKISIDSTGVSTSDLSVGGVDFADKADLNSTGVLKSTQIPDLSITSVDVVADQTARLNLTAEEGDVAIQTDINETFVLSTNDPTVNSNWKKVQLDVVGAIDGQTITPGQVGTNSNRVDILAEDINTEKTAFRFTGGQQTLNELDGIGGFTNNNTFAEINYTQNNVGTSPTNIASRPDDGSLLLVHGTETGTGFTQFTDIVLTAVNTQKQIASATSGADSRTYSSQGSGQVLLTMGSGSYKVSVFEFALGNRDS